MKTYLKIQFLFTLLLFVFFILQGCYQEDNIELITNQSRSSTEKYKINTSDNGSTSRSILISENYFSATIDTLTETVLSYDVSHSFLSERGISFAQLDSVLQAEMGSDYNTLFNDDKISHLDDPTFSGCMDGCDEDHRDENGDKIKGYGRCRFRCWVDVSVRIIDAVFPL